MDEVAARGTLVDRWRIWRDGRLIYADAPKLDGPIDTLMQYPAIGAGARAMAVVILAAARAAPRLEPQRLALGARAEERRVGETCVRNGRFRVSASDYRKKIHISDMRERENEDKVL